VLARALATAPGDRYADAAEMRAAVAPHVAEGRAELAALMTRLFGEELAVEKERLAAATPVRAAAVVMARAGKRRRGAGARPQPDVERA
jgi:hypothetical protein